MSQIDIKVVWSQFIISVEYLLMQINIYISSGVVRMWARIPAWPVAALVSLSKTLNHNCFVLRMGRKAVGPVCCVMHVKEPRTLIVKEKGLAPVFLDSHLEHPAGWIYALQIFCIIIIIIIKTNLCKFELKPLCHIRERIAKMHPDLSYSFQHVISVFGWEKPFTKIKVAETFTPRKF